jgi:hypothetical protein
VLNPVPLEPDASKRREIRETEERLKAAESALRSDKQRSVRELARQRKSVVVSQKKERTKREEKNELNCSKRHVKKAKLL